MRPPSVSSTTLPSVPATAWPSTTSTPRAASVRRARSDSRGWKLDSSTPAGSTRITRARRTSRRREVTGQHAAVQLGQAAGQLHAGGTTAGDDHVEHAVVDQSGVHRGPLELAQHVVPQAEGVLQALEPEAVLRHTGNAEGGRHRAGGQDQLVVLERGAVLHGQAPGPDVDAGDPAQADVHVAVAGHDAPNGRGDVVGVQAGGGHLVQQRLEGVEVVGVDQHHVHRHVTEVVDQLQASEPGAHHDHPMTAFHARRLPPGPAAGRCGFRAPTSIPTWRPSPTISRPIRPPIPPSRPTPPAGSAPWGSPSTTSAWSPARPTWSRPRSTPPPA